MIYEYRDSRDGRVFASEYGQGMCATKMMYAATCHDVPMCRVEWRKYMEGAWSEWKKLVPDFPLELRMDCSDGEEEYESWFFPGWYSAGGYNWGRGVWHSFDDTTEWLVFEDYEVRTEFEPPYIMWFNMDRLLWDNGAREYCSWFASIEPFVDYFAARIGDLEADAADYQRSKPWWRRIFQGRAE